MLLFTLKAGGVSWSEQIHARCGNGWRGVCILDPNAVIGCSLLCHVQDMHVAMFAWC